MSLQTLRNIIRDIYNSGNCGRALLYSIASAVGWGLVGAGMELRRIGKIVGKYPFHTYMVYEIDLSPLGNFLVWFGISEGILTTLISSYHLYRCLRG